MKYVLGIDIGTGSVKSVAVNLKTKPFKVAQEYYSFRSPQPGYHEQDPEQIWNAFKKSLKTIILEIGNVPMAVSLSSAMHSLILVDQECIALAPMITWADSRSAEVARRLLNSKDGLSIYEQTGTPIHAMSPLCKLIWLRENKPELFMQANKFISIKEYIWHRLFKEFKIDHSIASCTGLFNIFTKTWHQVSMDLAGIDTLRLSDAVATDYYKTFDPVDVDSEFNYLDSKILFFIGASDGCLSNLGSMATTSGTAVLTIGTSGAIRIASTKPLPNPKAMTFSYILDDKTFVCGGPINNGGLALQWWLKNYTSPNPSSSDYDHFFEKLNTIDAGSEGLIFLPYLTGERAPIWDSESCGTFFGVKLQHNLLHFSRAVLEGICYALKDVLEAVEGNADPITQINIGGGFVDSSLWVQALADITGKNLVIAQSEDASAIGAAYLAMKTLSFFKDYPTLDTSNLEIIGPDPQRHLVYGKYFKFYRDLYVNLKDTMHRHHQMFG